MSTPDTLVDQPARDAVATDLDATLFVEAGAGSGKTTSLVGRVCALVDGGVPLRHIAAITFTEKAAAELTHRVRTELEHRRRSRLGSTAVTTDLDAALADLDGAAIGTLHSFAQRLLAEHPIEAGLPPRIEILDEVSSEVAFEDRWQRFTDQILDDGTHDELLAIANACDIGTDTLRQLARTFDANWDLVRDRTVGVATEPTLPDVAPLLAELDEICGLGEHCTDAENKLFVRLGDWRTWRAAMSTAAEDEDVLALIKLLGPADGSNDPSWGVPSPKAGHLGKKTDWPDGMKAEIGDRLGAWCVRRTELRRTVGQAVIERAAALAASFTLDSALQRQRAGRLEFHDLLVLARSLLRGSHGPTVRQTLRHTYQRLLLDEFQDTDPIQVDLAVLLASDDLDAGEKPWDQVAVEDGRLFAVGDPKQSIYRFRRADISLFLAARRRLVDEPLTLTTNFRTGPEVIDWINAVFGDLIRADPEGRSQPDYQPLTPSPRRRRATVGPPVATIGTVVHDDEPKADELRRREAVDVARVIAQALADGWTVCDGGRDVDEDDPGSWRAALPGDVTVLIPSRLSLAALEAALEAAGVPYRAETSSLVYGTREIRDLLATLRSIDDPTDELMLVTALRSSLFGCGDDDLYRFRVEHGGHWNHRAKIPPTLPNDDPVASAMRSLAELHRDRVWIAPSELLERIVRDRRLLEVGFATGRPRDLWRRVRFVIDQARAWAEAGGASLRDYLRWVTRQSAETTRVSEAVLPETDDDSVRIMTIHAAKGLEFPITIVSGTSTELRGRPRGVEVTWPADGGVGLKLRSDVNDVFEAFQPIDEQMDRAERLRLLYVACTRARDHLVVSLHRTPRHEQSQRTSAAVLAHAVGRTDATASALAPQPTAGPVEHRPMPTQPMAWDAWREDFEALRRASSRQRSIGATGVAALAAERDRETPENAAGDPGLAKDPRDLDLPPWSKGRYGTAIGRAVHGVLQTVDLATGAGIAEAAAAQSAAEAVESRVEVVERLARAALRAPTVVESTRHESWRETYVATTVGDTTVEGYLDLLYRADDGLVIVDYKTDLWRTEADLDTKMHRYRLQGATYALALAEATDEPVVRCVFVFVGGDEPVERALAGPALLAAIAEARSLVGGPAGGTPTQLTLT